MKLNIDQSYSQADPYLIIHNNEYFMYVTGQDGVDLYFSKDYLNWKRVGLCYTKANEKEFWAPCVIELDGLFYMYVSSMPIDKEDTHEQRIQVAKANSPYGPFEFVDFLIEPFSIDPHVVISGKQLFMFYSVNNYTEGRVGTYIVVDKMTSPTKMAGKPKTVVVPTLDEEIFMKDRFKKGQHWHTLEGAFYFRKGDYHYLMYSGNCYQNEHYYIGYAVAKTKENDLTKISFRKYPSDNIYSPLICKNEVEEGTGHNSLLEINGHYYVFYHGRDLDIKQNGKDRRTARICEILPEGEIIRIVKRQLLKNLDH